MRFKSPRNPERASNRRQPTVSFSTLTTEYCNKAVGPRALSPHQQTVPLLLPSCPFVTFVFSLLLSPYSQLIRYFAWYSHACMFKPSIHSRTQ